MEEEGEKGMDWTCTLRHGGLLGLIIEGCVEGKSARVRP